jgi:hypothetical protein
MNRPSTPPPAHNLTVLSSDLLAVAAKRIVEQLACAKSWEPMAQLKNALDVYESVRIGGIVNDIHEVTQRGMRVTNEPAPETTRSAVRS